MARYDCFILRIWRSQGDHGEQWAGRLEHLSGTETLRFNDVETLLQYLNERIAPRGSGPPAPPGAAPPPDPRAG
ncbi:MAG TPA: hypothetical protein VHB98_12335 [Chloroflexota bacterium]|nr:hypothetical protein [Chloroflexota bacterium]